MAEPTLLEQLAVAASALLGAGGLGVLANRSYGRATATAETVGSAQDALDVAKLRAVVDGMSEDLDAVKVAVSALETHQSDRETARTIADGIEAGLAKAERERERQAFEDSSPASQSQTRATLPHLRGGK